MLSCSSHCTGRCGFRPPFWGGAKPSGRTVCRDVDRSGPRWTRSRMKKPTYTKANLSDVRVIMEKLCGRVAMSCGDKWIPVLTYLISGVRGHLWPCHVIPGIKCRRFLRTRLQWCLPGTKSPWARLPGARACVESREMRLTGLTGDKILLVYSYQDKEKD
jgi:hypothetical protein